MSDLVAGNEGFFPQKRGVAVDQVPSTSVNGEEVKQVGILRGVVNGIPAEIALMPIELVH